MSGLIFTRFFMINWADDEPRGWLLSTVDRLCPELDTKGLGKDAGQLPFNSSVDISKLRARRRSPNRLYLAFMFVIGLCAESEFRGDQRKIDKVWEIVQTKSRLIVKQISLEGSPKEYQHHLLRSIYLLDYVQRAFADRSASRLNSIELVKRSLALFLERVTLDHQSLRFSDIHEFLIISEIGQVRHQMASDIDIQSLRRVQVLERTALV